MNKLCLLCAILVTLTGCTGSEPEQSGDQYTYEYEGGDYYCVDSDDTYDYVYIDPVPE